MTDIVPDSLAAFGTPRSSPGSADGRFLPQLASFAEVAIILPAGCYHSAWKLDWQVAHGALVRPGTCVVAARSDGGQPWSCLSPVPALVDILPLPAARLPGGTKIGILRYGEGLEALLGRLRRQRGAKLRRLHEEAAAARRQCEQAAASLDALRRELAELTAAEQLPRPTATGRQTPSRLQSGGDLPEAIPPHLLLATLLQRLSSLSGGGAAPGGPAVSATLRAPLLQLLTALLKDGAPPAGPAGGSPADADAAAACTALARLYDRRMKAVLAAQPGVPPALTAEKATLWHQLRETHLALLRAAAPLGSPSPLACESPSPLACKSPSPLACKSPSPLASASQEQTA